MLVAGLKISHLCSIFTALAHVANGSCGLLQYIKKMHEWVKASTR